MVASWGTGHFLKYDEGPHFPPARRRLQNSLGFSAANPSLCRRKAVRNGFFPVLQQRSQAKGKLEDLEPGRLEVAGHV